MVNFKLDDFTDNLANSLNNNNNFIGPMPQADGQLEILDEDDTEEVTLNFDDSDFDQSNNNIDSNNNAPSNTNSNNTNTNSNARNLPKQARLNMNSNDNNNSDINRYSNINDNGGHESHPNSGSERGQHNSGESSDSATSADRRNGMFISEASISFTINMKENFQDQRNPNVTSPAVYARNEPWKILIQKRPAQNSRSAYNSTESSDSEDSCISSSEEDLSRIGVGSSLFFIDLCIRDFYFISKNDLPHVPGCRQIFLPSQS